MPEERLRSPTVLVGVLVVHAMLAWGLTQLGLHPERLVEPIVVALLREPPPEPEVQARPLPQADVPVPVRRTPAPVVQPARPEPVAPAPQSEPREPIASLPPAPVPAPMPAVQPAPVPEPQQVVREAPQLPVPTPQPEAAAAAPMPMPHPVVEASAPPPPAPAPAAEEAPVTQPLYSAGYLRNPKPRYPMLSRRLGEEGLVTLRVYVTSAGEPRQVELKESCGFPRLDQAAQDVVRSWRFVPAKRGDSPVDAWVLVPIRFTLKG